MLQNTAQRHVPQGPPRAHSPTVTVFLTFMLISFLHLCFIPKLTSLIAYFFFTFEFSKMELYSMFLCVCVCIWLISTWKVCESYLCCFDHFHCCKHLWDCINLFVYSTWWTFELFFIFECVYMCMYMYPLWACACISVCYILRTRVTESKGMGSALVDTINTSSKIIWWTGSRVPPNIFYFLVFMPCVIIFPWVWAEPSLSPKRCDMASGISLIRLCYIAKGYDNSSWLCCVT